MRLRISSVLVALALTASSLMAQEASTTDSGRAYLIEHSYSSPRDSAIVTLRKGVMYWAELDGPGRLEVQSSARNGWPALVVAAGAASNGSRRFEVHAGSGGSYVVRLLDFSPTITTTARIYRDDAETERFADSHDRDFAIGLLFGGGGHTGYRLETAVGDPRGGRQFEGGILTQSGNWFSALIGLSRQSLREPDFAVAWFFLEPRARIASAELLKGYRTDVALTLRFGAAPETGPHHLPPNLIAPGVTLTHHLSSGGRRRGFAIYAAWRHGWVSNIPEPEHRTTDEFTTGLAWVP